MGADYSFYVKFIATCAPTFFEYIILVLAIVTSLYVPAALPTPLFRFHANSTSLKNIPTQRLFAFELS